MNQETHSTSSVQACQNCKKDFIIEPDDFVFYKKMKVPAPTWCFDCRMRRKLVYRNERTLYHDVCASCGEKIISMYEKNSGYTVYCTDCWWSDKWDATKYGRDYDFSKTFFGIPITSAPAIKTFFSPNITFL